jgi:hypothetical protein
VPFPTFRRNVALGCTLASLAIASTMAAVPQPSEPATLPMGPARFRADIRTVKSSWDEIHDHGAAAFFLAQAYAELGEPQEALSLLRSCPLDEGFDPNGVGSFKALQANAEFRALEARVHREFPPVHHARVAFTMADTELFPEGIAADPARHVFYMGSQYHDKIIRVTAAGAATDFVSEGAYDLMPVGGVHVDEADHSVWAVTDPGSKNRSELVHFDGNGKLLERHLAPGRGPHDLNDFVLRASREIYVTDTDGNRVYRFDRRTHSFSPLAFPRPILYPNGITLSGDGNFLYVADMLGVLRVDLHSHAAHEVSVAGHFTLAGVDGLYWYRGGLVGLQYGAGAYRAMQWRLTADGMRVASARMLEYRTALVANPTTGAIVGGNFYFMANTGIDNLRDGHIADRAKLAPISVAVARLD